MKSGSGIINTNGIQMLLGLSHSTPCFLTSGFNSCHIQPSTTAVLHSMEDLSPTLRIRPKANSAIATSSSSTLVVSIFWLPTNIHRNHNIRYSPLRMCRTRHLTSTRKAENELQNMPMPPAIMMPLSVRSWIW